MSDLQKELDIMKADAAIDARGLLGVRAYSKRHKWGGSNNNSGSKSTSNNGGLAVGCIKCGCVREYVKGIPTYFIDDQVHDRYAPPCDNRHLA